MNIKEYQINTAMTKAPLTDQYSDMDAIHMVLGMTTEVGEIVDVYKKNLAYCKPMDLTNVKEEIGDLMWYISELCNYHGWQLEDILQTNIDKLRSRFPNKFNSKDAINRNLERERQILEDDRRKLDPMPPDISMF